MKKEIGKRIKEIRENIGMTKEKLAKELDISSQYLGIVEKGNSCFSVDKLKKFCDFTNSSADYVLFGKDNNSNKQIKESISGFSNEQISIGCDMLKQLALFIKNE